jgi:cytochrome P450 family 110
MAQLPDGPKTPSFLQTIEWILYPLEVLDARAHTYGDTFRILGKTRPPLLYFSSPEAIQAIFTAPSEQLDSARNNSILKPLLGEHSLILLDGDRHQQQRQLLMPPFHGERMRAYGQLIYRLTQQLISQWQLGQSFAVRPAMQEISLRVILSAVFGLHEGARYEQLRQLLSVMLDTFSSPLSSFPLFYPVLQKDLGAWSPWGRFLRQRQQIHQLLDNEIVERLEAEDSDREDILSLLLAARDVEGQPMSRAEIRDELVTLLFAGHETTASALAWALYWIHRLPEVKTKLLSELDGVDFSGDLSQIMRLPYLTAVCQETLRLYPIAINAFPRIVRQPMQFMGYELEPGTALLVSIYLAHHRASVYPEPKQFKPERFLERQFSPYEYLPFGGGDRRCIGLAFAQYEMKLVLATLLSELQLTLVDQRPVKPTRRGLTMAPSSHLRLKVTGVQTGIKARSQAKVFWGR